MLKLEQELALYTRGAAERCPRPRDANEEHKAINEEAMSVNEEFQSTNEELETSKEELQSLNEELTALNSQLQETVEQQRATSDDLQNIFNSTDVATLFLDGDFENPLLHARREVTLQYHRLRHRPATCRSTRRFEDDDLLADARTVLASHAPSGAKSKPTTAAGSCEECCRIGATTRSVEGVVITFAGISEIKAAEAGNQAARAYLDSIIATIRQPLVVLDEELRVISASSSFYRVFSVKPEATLSGGSFWPRPIISMCRRSATSWPRSRTEAPPSRIMRSRSNCRAWDGARS